MSLSAQKCPGKKVNSRGFLRYLGVFDGAHLAVGVNLGRGCLEDRILAGGNRKAGPRIGAESVLSSLQVVLALDPLAFGSLKKIRKESVTQC